MKKVLKVKITRTQSGGGTHYDYPAEYDPKKFQVITYESILTDKINDIVSRGNDHEYVIGLVEDIDAQAFLVNPDIVELNRTQSEAFLSPDLDKSVLKIDDINSVLGILAKSVKGEILTNQEKDLIDDTKQSSLIKKSKTFKEVLDTNGIV